MNAQPLDLTLAAEALTAQPQAFERFAQMLMEHNRSLNLTRMDHPQDIRTRHFLDSLAALAIVDEPASRHPTNTPFSVMDVGSGAGFPALALAIARPNWRVVSLEATEKKVRFQRRVCEALGLGNVELLHGRAEILAHDPTQRERFDAVTARAVAPLNVLAELTLAFIRPGGLALFWKGPNVRQEYDAARKSIKMMGGSALTLHSYALPDLPETAFYLVAAAKHAASPATLPRRHFGIIKKRPLSHPES